MKFEPGFLYHVYNQSNRKDILFRDTSDYSVFLEKVRKWVFPNSEILSYCLMPNHYHFLILANDESIIPKKLGSLTTNELSNGFRIVQSQYAQYFNEKYGLTGAVFRPRPKAKCLNDGTKNYALTCFLYIHQNPVKAGLCLSPFDWRYSSASELKNGIKDSLINLEEIRLQLGLDLNDIKSDLLESQPDNRLKRIF